MSDDESAGPVSTGSDSAGSGSADYAGSAYESILVTRHGRVGLITLNRPDALNALNEVLRREIIEVALELDTDEEVGAIVITGSERAFAAGADITELAGKTHRELTMSGIFNAWDAFAAIRTPTIAAVAGYALGGGCEVAMMCDIIIAADTARFGQPEVKIGVIPGMGGTQRLTRAIGKAKAMDLILTGRTMDAEEAERSGLVSRVVAADKLLDEVLEIAAGIAALSLPVVYAAKEAVSVAFESTLAEGVRFERQTFNGLFDLDDRREGMRAFIEKRPPHFTNG
ncbi:MAG: enoyl-CoA hydratase [Microbacteriaceae bacterium]|nr:MAG: enoyl-CoA hydratase [Microbacteriaceae bacterium]